MSKDNTARQFETTTTPHLNAAYNLARWLTQNPHDAEDVVQEAWLRAFRFFGAFDGTDARAWLLAIVRNTCFTWLRQNRKGFVTATEEELQALVDAKASDPDMSGDPEKIFLRCSEQDALQRAVEDLPIEFREVIVLREMEEFSYKQIATACEIPIGTVMSRLARGRSLLKRRLERNDRGS